MSSGNRLSPGPAITKPVKQQDREENPLNYDAYNREKAIHDVSILSSIWTFSISSQQWLEFEDGVEDLSFTNFTSENGRLKCSGGAGVTRMLMSKRHPRYQSNRGQLYSNSMYLPDFTSDTVFEFGMFTEHNGVFFRTQSGVLYAVRRRLIDGVVEETAAAIDVPAGVDLTKGNLFDIQMQWRGVGNIEFLINLQTVYLFDLLGTLDQLSVSNSAMPIAFQVTGAGVMYSGCVDVTSEGGSQPPRTRFNYDSGEVALGVSSEVPVLSVTLPNTIVYNGTTTMNTRDAVLMRITGYADDNTVMRVYITRDPAVLNGTTYGDLDAIGSIQGAIDGAITWTPNPATTQRPATRRIPAGADAYVDNPDQGVSDFYMTHGDYLLVTMEAKNSTVGGVTLEFGVEA